MGTRADFYVREGKNLDFIGSVSMDGYEWADDPTCTLMNSVTKSEFVNAVERRADYRKWVWPWDTSKGTDFSYVYNVGTHLVEVYHYGKPQGNYSIEFPNMQTKCPCCGQSLQDDLCQNIHCES